MLHFMLYLSIYCNVFHIDVSYFKITYNPGQNIWYKVKKYSKIGQAIKNVISIFACFLTAIVNV